MFQVYWGRLALNWHWNRKRVHHWDIPFFTRLFILSTSSSFIVWIWNIWFVHHEHFSVKQPKSTNKQKKRKWLWISGRSEEKRRKKKGIVQEKERKILRELLPYWEMQKVIGSPFEISLLFPPKLVNSLECLLSSSSEQFENDTSLLKRRKGERDKWNELNPSSSC